MDIHNFESICLLLLERVQLYWYYYTLPSSSGWRKSSQKFFFFSSGSAEGRGEGIEDSALEASIRARLLSTVLSLSPLSLSL